MKTTAYEFLAHVYAGLNLWDIVDGVAEWVGTDQQWSAYKMSVQLFEEGLLPNI